MEKLDSRHIRGARLSCFGCGVCENTCPVHAIKMWEDSLGFLYPEVDDSACISCGKCLRECPDEDNARKNVFNKPVKYYGVRLNNPEELAKSQSGGAFGALAEFVIAHGGIVYGAVFDSECKVRHVEANTKDELERMHGSKYVQSKIVDCLDNIKQNLENGKVVLFSGTPCQVAAVKLHISKKLQDRLILVDILCHGVGSPSVWASHIHGIENKEGQKIISAKCRDKSISGWHGFTENIVLGNGKSVHSNEYTEIFMKQIAYRQSCYQCPFANIQRVGDITIGDLWGVEKTKLAKEASDEKGMSLLMVNTEKGISVFEAAKEYLHYMEMEQSDIMQPRLKSPSEKNPLRDKFERWYEKGGLDYALRKWGYHKGLDRLKIKVMGIFPSSVREQILSIKNKISGK